MVQYLFLILMVFLAGLHIMNVLHVLAIFYRTCRLPLPQRPVYIYCPPLIPLLTIVILTVFSPIAVYQSVKNLENGLLSGKVKRPSSNPNFTVSRVPGNPRD